MKQLPLAKYLPNVSNLAFGCMGLGGGWNQEPVSKQDLDTAHKAVDAALEQGINFFDHADIYTMGKAEQVFGQLLKQRPELRSQIYLQSKCAIRFEDTLGPGRYDHSEQWIVSSVEGILTRLGIEQLDVLLLHRPDPLMAPEEVAITFEKLIADGKVKHFGVSNMHRHQMELLNRFLPTPLVVNQIEMSLAKTAFLDQGVTVGMPESAEAGFDTGLLEYCQLNDIQIQSWGSLAQGLFSGKDVSQAPENVRQTAQLASELANKYDTSSEAIVLGWLMKLPQRIQPVIGTINPSRIAACADAVDISEKLTREDWYRLFVSSRGKAMP